MRVKRLRAVTLGSALTLAAISSATAAWSQELRQPDPASLDADGAWHVVRPGDTLQSIAARYLADPGGWRDRLEYLPVTDDPDRIYPGQRIELSAVERLPSQHAMLVAATDGVIGQYTPLAWSPVWTQDLLQPEDGLRTKQGDSALLRFDDDTRLVLTEDSVVFLRATGTEVTTVDRKMIEVVTGQADLGSQRRPGEESDIEIVLGPSSARPAAGPDGMIQTRTRLAQDRGAQVMVYEGSSSLASGGGQQVELARGMGVALDQGGTAAAPERLLPAAEIRRPAAGERWPLDGPPFAWAAVDGARSYTVEVCEDPDCGRLVARVTGIGGTEWQPAGLPLGELLWRVTATSASDLDGYPSPPVRFTVSRDPADREPPTALARFAGPQVSVYDELIVGKGTVIQVETADRGGSGVDRWEATIDGEAVDPEILEGPWPPGPHELAVATFDRAGNRHDLGPIAFTYDPDPPLLRWASSENFAYPLGEARGRIARTDSSDGDGDGAPFRRRVPEVLWSEDGASWSPLVGQPGVRSDRARLALRTAKGRIEIPAIGVTLGPDEPLWIEAPDALSRAVNLTVQLIETAGGDRRRGRVSRPVLRVRAIDLLANTTEVEWPLAPARR